MTNNAAIRVIALCAAVATLAVVGTGSASAMPAVGTNDVLDNVTGGDLFIPLQNDDSGVLGDLIDGGPERVGVQADTVCLSALNPTSSGYVTFELVFDITADLGAFPNMDRNTTRLLLTFDDIDFKTDVYSNYTLNEILTLEFRADPGGPASGVPLTIDESNYHVYSGMAPGHETDNVQVTYEISLKNDLGITEADFLDMEADKDFALLVRFDSQLELTSGFLACPTNSAEAIGNRFTLVGVPEPTSVALLTAGALALIRRRSGN